jgi:hypothetical protein
MSYEALHVFLGGAIACASLVAGLFFVRYWVISRDRFFIFFSAAFGIMAANWAAIATLAPTEETRHYFYVLRLLAFVMILFAIVDKNRRPRR